MKFRCVVTETVTRHGNVFVDAYDAEEAKDAAMELLLEIDRRVKWGREQRHDACDVVNVEEVAK